MSASPRATAVLQLVLTALLWSLAGVGIKAVSMSGLGIAGWRSAFAGLFLLCVLPRERFTWSFSQIAASVCYAATMLTFVSATKLTTAANAILLQYTAPLYVAVAAPRLLGEPTAKNDWLTLAMALGGMVLFFCGSLSGEGLAGNILALVSGASFAGIALFLRGQKHQSPSQSILLGNALTVALCLPFMFEESPGAQGWLVLAFLGVFQTGLSYYLYSLALQHVRALDALLIPIIEPVLNPVWVLFVHGEVPAYPAVAGGLLVLTASVIRGFLLLGRGASRSPGASRPRTAA